MITTFRVFALVLVFALLTLLAQHAILTSSIDGIPSVLIIDDPTKDGANLLRNVFSQAGINVDEELTGVDFSFLWSRVEQLYYNTNHTTTTTTAGPVIIGKERCAEFRQKQQGHASVAMAGLFNTGTNAMLRNLQLNMGIPGKENASEWSERNNLYTNLHGVEFEVPWWKHNPKIDDDWCCGRNPERHKHIVPIVLIRDPLVWRNSMCRQKYTLGWDGDRFLKCPEVLSIKNGEDPIPMILPKPVWFYIRARNPKTIKYQSLMDVWNQYYRAYLDADFPRLMIRFEDVLFHLPQVVQEIRDCVGGYAKHVQIKVHADPAKDHTTGSSKKASNLIKTIFKTADVEARLSDLSQAELEYTQQVLDRDLMKTFMYNLPLEQD